MVSKLERTRANKKKWALANPEKIKASSIKWKKNNPEKARANTKKWKLKNSEHIQVYNNIWWAAHPDYQRQWYRDNRKKMCKKSTKWKREHPEEIQDYLGRPIVHMKVNARAAAHKFPMQECIVCGARAKLHRHHPDYTKPLEVVVLCSGLDSCHAKEHEFAKTHNNHFHSMRWWKQYAKEHKKVIT